MKRTTTIAIILAAIVTAVVVVISQQKPVPPISYNSNAETNATTDLNASPDTTNTNAPVNGAPSTKGTANTNVPTSPTLVMPLWNFYQRVTKKPYGIYITPATSPVQPEKFHGYHTGADAEVSQEEGAIDVPVYAIADGTVTMVAYLRGYGGVIMIRHVVDGETVTALYGHVRQSSVAFSVGDTVHAGDQIALLGSGYTSEAQNERKHLHFGLLKGVSKDTRGYVNSGRELGPWLDTVLWLQERNAHDPRG